VETILANPFSKMKCEPHINQAELNKHASEFMLCCGLALSKLR
jgi:Tfp pilus assembly PilM family ATPase